MRSLPLLISLERAEKPLDVLAEELDFPATQLALAKLLLDKGLPPLSTPDVLPYLFGVSHQLIGYMEKFPDNFYRTFRVKKNSGGYREIVAPRRVLKTIQRWIYVHICLKAAPNDCVMGFIKGKNIFDNGRVHAKNRNLMVIDISDFFPSVKFAQVEDVFRHFKFPERVAHQLTALCCLHECLPQGAPTSPALANLVFRPVDLELSKLSKEWGCSYTRYADDLAFSGSKVFSEKDKSRVAQVLNQFGFSINERKSRIIGQGGRQMVAGLVINHCALPPRATRRRWRAMFHRASRYRREFADRVQNLSGIVSFVNQFEPETALKYRKVLEKVQRSL